MAANLTPQYQKAEQQYRRAQTAAEQETCLLRMLQLIPKHKGTEKLQADLKSRLKEVRQLRQQEQEASSRSGNSYRFAAQGAGRIVIVGPPNGGKSRILRDLTSATPEVSPWPFTTREPSAGMMSWKDVSIQLIDTPPLAGNQPEPWLLNLIRTADAVLLVFNGADDDAPAETLRVLQELNRRKTRLSTESGFDETDFAVLRIPTRIVATHAADSDCTLRLEMFRELCVAENIFTDLLDTIIPVELDRSELLPQLADVIYSLLNLIRIYTRRPGTAEIHPEPVTIPSGGTVEDLALALHEELFEQLSHARVWRQLREEFVVNHDRPGSQTTQVVHPGHSVHNGQTVGRQYVLIDGDVVELHR
jgi:hypothetical protein